MELFQKFNFNRSIHFQDREFVEVDLPFNGSGPKRALVGGSVGGIGGAGGLGGSSGNPGGPASSLSPAASPTSNREFSIFTACCGGGPSGCCAKVTRILCIGCNLLKSPP